MARNWCCIVNIDIFIYIVWQVTFYLPPAAAPAQENYLLCNIVRSLGRIAAARVACYREGGCMQGSKRRRSNCNDKVLVGRNIKAQKNNYKSPRAEWEALSMHRLKLKLYSAKQLLKEARLEQFIEKPTTTKRVHSICLLILKYFLK